MHSSAPKKAMVLAAGLGLRMRPITEKTPKPLIKIAGKPLLDWGLDALAQAGVAEAVVNVHYLPDQIRAHVAGRTAPRIVISDETEQLLDSAGGIVKALPTFGTSPFFLVNADTFWIDGTDPDLLRLALAWDAGKMDMLLMLADPHTAVGHTGKTDFLLAGDGTLARSGGNESGLIYAGAAIIDPAVFGGAGATSFGSWTSTTLGAGAFGFGFGASFFGGGGSSFLGGGGGSGFFTSTNRTFSAFVFSA